MDLLTIQVKDIESYEGKGAVVFSTIGSNKFPDHETHVRVEGKMLRGLAYDGVSARASHRGPPDETIEIGDRRRLSAMSR